MALEARGVQNEQGAELHPGGHRLKALPYTVDTHAGEGRACPYPAPPALQSQKREVHIQVEGHSKRSLCRPQDGQQLRELSVNSMCPAGMGEWELSLGGKVA